MFIYILWPKLHVRCEFGPNKLSGLDARVKILQKTF